ncbi:MAG TPA: nucleotide exchange factor GrpE [Pseudogracilibacillus sp.]|nr:nucleotide exchange factor GrpE [Pseudogracilibacillus sp.]
MNEQAKEKVTSEEEEVVETATEESDTVKEEVDEKEESQSTEEIADSPEEDNVKQTYQKEIDQLTEENEKLKERMLRVQAEFENYKKRTQKEKAADRKYKSEELATELLTVLDNFERALQTETSNENKGFIEGMQMIYSQLQEVLKTQGVEPIDTENEQFDPTYHHAVMQIEDEEIESNIIVEELQKGYMLKDKVIRPAMVKVNK